MRKTAMQQYINDALKGEAKEMSYYLKLEEQQIIEAFESGQVDSVQMAEIDLDNANKYYELTYNTKQ